MPALAQRVFVVQSNCSDIPSNKICICISVEDVRVVVMMIDLDFRAIGCFPLSDKPDFGYIVGFGLQFGPYQ